MGLFDKLIKEGAKALQEAASEENKIAALFGRPITIILLTLTVATLIMNIPAVKRLLAKLSKRSII